LNRLNAALSHKESQLDSTNTEVTKLNSQLKQKDEFLQTLKDDKSSEMMKMQSTLDEFRFANDPTRPQTTMGNTTQTFQTSNSVNI